jgi:hypothetical protein
MERGDNPEVAASHYGTKALKTVTVLQSQALGRPDGRVSVGL